MPVDCGEHSRCVMDYPPAVTHDLRQTRMNRVRCSHLDTTFQGRETAVQVSRTLPYPQPVTSAEDLVQHPDGSAPPDLRIGTPEREAAREALHEHHAADRLDQAEYEQRWATCQTAGTQAELRQVFVDLPAPHPDLPTPPDPSMDTDEDMPPLAVAICLALLLGLPVTVVLGFVYGAWWGLAVPVALSVALVYAEHLRTRARTQ